MQSQTKSKKSPKPFFDSLRNMADPAIHRVSPNDVANALGTFSREAMRDYQMAAEFIYAYRGSQETFRRYRRTIEQLLAWTWLLNEQPLKQLKRQDIERFMEFGIKPPRGWIGKTRQVRFKEVDGAKIPNPEWRPFCSKHSKYSVSAGTLKARFNTLGSFFNFLIEEDYIPLNPVAHIRQKSKFIKNEQETPPPRVLSNTQWRYVLDAAEELAESHPEMHERTLFMFAAMFSMYLRISELVETERWRPTMGDFFRDSRGRWWFRTIGKGNKERVVSVCDDMLKSLARYRRHRGLKGLPMPGEKSVLVHGRSKSGTLTATRIRQLCKEVFLLAASRLRAMGETDDAEILEVASPHWLRHTGISFDVPRRPIHHIRDDAGHSSVRTTNRYIDSALAERHDSAQRKSVYLDFD